MRDYYGAHPFPSREEFRLWELETENHYDIEIVNPFYDLGREDIKAVDEGLKERYDFDPATIVLRDITAMLSCQKVLVWINGEFSIGTIIEFIIAVFLRKETHVVVTNGHQDHPWIKYFATEIYTSFDEFVDNEL